MQITRRHLIAATATLPVSAALAATPTKLRLMATSDLHMFVLDHDYYHDKPDPTVGLAKTAALIHAARTELPNTMLFDNGDIIQGSPLGDWIAAPGHLPAGAPHPMLAAMALLGYDAATVGNHEFNFGLDFLEASLARSAFPFVCANVTRADGSPFLLPYRVITRTLRMADGTDQPIRVGVIGFVTPQIMRWDRSNLAGKLLATDIVDAARQHLPALRARCDIVVALSHSGINASPRLGGDENASLYLAEAAHPLGGIDAMFTGHSHQVFPGPTYAGRAGVDAARGSLHGVPAVMPGFWGSHLAVIDLDLRHDGKAWSVGDYTSRAVPIYRREGAAVISLAEDDAAIVSSIGAAHQATRDWVAAPVGALAAPVASYFAMVGDNSVMDLINQAQIWYARQALAGSKDTALPLLAAAAPFKAGYTPDAYVDIAAGPVAIRDLADLYLYPNTLSAVRVTGAVLREWLERSAGAFNRIDPTLTAPQPLLDKRFPSYNFDIISDLSFRIDLTAPSRYGARGDVLAPDAHRILDLRYQGAPIDPAAEFVVVTNNYRADGGGNFPGLDGSSTILRAPDTNRDALLRYVASHRPIAPAQAGTWSFGPLPTHVVLTFDGSPLARNRLIKGVSWVGAGQGGFDRFRFDLSA